MAQTNATINIAVNGINQLDRLQATLRKTQDRFGGLKTAILGIGFGAAGRSAIAMADDLQDLSDATGITVARLREFQQTLVTSGGRAEAMANGINTFVRSIDEAAQGSAKTQNTFRELGISLEDLGSLSEQDLLIKTLEGIARLEDRGRQATIMMDLFGKAMRGVNPQAMADGLRNSAGSADSFANSIARAAKLNDDLATAAGNFRLALLEAFKGPIQLLASLSEEANNSKEAMNTLITVIKAVGVALTIAFAFTGFALIVRAVGTIGRGLVGLGQLFSKLASQGTSAAGSIVGGFGAQSILMKSLRGIAGVISVIIGAVTGIKLFSEDETPQINATNQALEEQAKKTREVKAAYEEKTKAIREGFNEFAKNIQQTANQISLDTELIGKSKEYADILRAQRELTNRTTQEIEKLQRAKALLSEEELKGGLGAVYDEQIAKVRELAAAEGQRIEALIKGLNEAERANQFRLFTIQEEYRLTDQLRDIQDEMAKSTMSEIERKYYDIEVAARKAAESAIRAEESRIGRRLTEEEARKYYEESARGTEILKQKQGELYENSRRFSTGWGRAFREYVDNATNAARTAENLFRKATQGMEDAIVNFAKTGRFEWKNFVNMMLEELLRAQIQSLFAQILGTMSGGMRGMSGGGGGRAVGGGGGGGLLGGVLGSLGGLFGGGKTPPVISGGGIGGGQGGGIFARLGNIGSSIAGGFSSAVSGIGDFFSGFFANGGMIPQGRFGIVGERGPEFVGGPASVTPMTGTTVTYNINAVDAPSFQALLARDPSFIYALTEQGRKGYPGAR